jgi:hypothetical protein
MKRALVICLTAKELQELYRVVLDSDAEGTLVFVQEHLPARLLMPWTAAERC